MIFYIFIVWIIFFYFVYESIILFQWFILLKILKYVILFLEIKIKKNKNMLLDNRVFVENNYYKYVVIMLVKIYIIKKIMYGS